MAERTFELVCRSDGAVVSTKPMCLAYAERAAIPDGVRDGFECYRLGPMTCLLVEDGEHPNG